MVEAFDDAAEVLAAAGAFLAGDPVRNNLVLTLLHRRAAHPEPGRYWVAEDGGRCTGVTFQSPLPFVATVTPMADEVTEAMAEAIAGAGVPVPGVSGVSATAACFAGQWSERVRCSVLPSQAQRILEIEHVTAPVGVGGTLRPAGEDDHHLLVTWMGAFGAEAGGTADDAAAVVSRRLPAGELWVWDDGGPASFAGLSAARAGVVRIGPVYTPKQRRRRGYASAMVATLAQALLDQPVRSILYTDLANPVSNSIYRRVGYRAVAEVLRYDFRPGG